MTEVTAVSPPDGWIEKNFSEYYLFRHSFFESLKISYIANKVISITLQLD
jgi:hypothetical protein